MVNIFTGELKQNIKVLYWLSIVGNIIAMRKMATIEVINEILWDKIVCFRKFELCLSESLHKKEI